jgi:hypothetical protein
VRRRRGQVGGQQPLTALLQAAGWLGAGHLDDPTPLVLGQAPGRPRPGQVGQSVQPVGVEAVQPLGDRLGMAAQRLGDLGDGAPSQLPVMMRARWIQLAGAPAGGQLTQPVRGQEREHEPAGTR